jgi:GntR family transcriptional repressor for pyruvate dehydrogenase complex
MALHSTALSRRSLADQVADAVVSLILDDGLQDGDVLPSTAELSERFDVSRTVVREALADLAGRGVISRSQGRECVVATPGRDELTRLLQFRIRTDAVSADQILDIREALEVAAARSAATVGTPAAKAAIRETFERLRAARTEPAYHEADIALHRSMAEASGNRLTVLILDGLVDFLHDVRVRATKNRKQRGADLKEIIELHEAIVIAIEAGDGDAAAEAMQVHLAQTRAEFRTPARSRQKNA